MKIAFTTAVACGLMTSAAFAAETAATVMNSDGAEVGTVSVSDTESGVALAKLSLTNLPEGGIAVHLHETGDCSGEGFKSAGGHIAGDREHGVLAAGGPHPGDMPNVTVNSDGTVEQEVFLPFLNVEEHLMDDDGAAFVTHGGQDDYSSQPSGDAGDRIACGTFGADPA